MWLIVGPTASGSLNKCHIKLAQQVTLFTQLRKQLSEPNTMMDGCIEV